MAIIDKETKDYCLTVARILKERHAELSEVGRMEGLSTMDSVVERPKKETKHRSADSNIKKNSELTESGVMCCIPTMDSISSGQANEIQREYLQSWIPKRASTDIGDQRINQYLSMCAPERIDPVAHERGMMTSHDASRTCVMGMYQQYLHNQVTTNSSRPIILSNAEMPRPILSGHIQQGIQGVQMKGSQGDDELDFPIMPFVSCARVQMNGSHGYDGLEFPIIAHVSQRAMISNMISANRTSSKQPISHSEEIHSFTERRRWSAPECLQTSKHEQPQAYDAQELDITDSDVVGMWLSSNVKEDD
ncbi:hypothetical protein ACHAXA_000794 [Cyclostephanos tholiformis]|uniref:Uncharacterized protein n=1 Tax=Cyclostephanos tholiformis TaxID=382380 RepID=A0ABD3R5D8_9STRA